MLKHLTCFRFFLLITLINFRVHSLSQGSWNRSSEGYAKASTDLVLSVQSREPSTFDLPLRYWARQRGINLGAAVLSQPLGADTRYRWKLAQEFNLLIPENAMKFSNIQPEQGHYWFKSSDQLVDFAESYAMQVRGHTLVWHRRLPNWLTEGDWTREETKALLRDHIQTVVGRYRGHVQAWDVVNEAFGHDGILRDSFWLRQLGPEYIELAFRWAHEADPEAVLIYNDYANEDMGPKSTGIYSKLQELRQKGVPVHGVGLQMHLTLDQVPPMEQLTQNIERLTQLGLQVHITEMDIRLQSPITPEKLHRQAQIYGQMMQICLSNPGCRSLSVWGVSDQYSWIPSTYPGWEGGLLLDTSFLPKPAYDAVKQELIDDRL